MSTLGERIVFQNSEPWPKQSRGLKLFTYGANCETVTVCFDKISYIELTKDVLKPASSEFVYVPLITCLTLSKYLSVCLEVQQFKHAWWFRRWFDRHQLYLT